MNYLEFMSKYVGKNIPAIIPAEANANIGIEFTCRRLFNSTMNIQFAGKFMEKKDGLLIWKVIFPTCNTCFQRLHEIKSFEPPCDECNDVYQAFQDIKWANEWDNEDGNNEPLLNLIIPKNPCNDCDVEDASKQFTCCEQDPCLNCQSQCLLAY